MIEMVDTNILVRMLIGDVKDQKVKAITIFEQAEKGKRKLSIKSVVLAETCFVLESFYKKNREVIAGALKILLSQKWLIIEERKIMQNTWKWYLKGFHFVDSYLLASTEINGEKILSFDKKLMNKVK